MRAVGYPEDIGARLFSPKFDEALTRVMATHLLPGADVRLAYAQDRTAATFLFTDQKRGPSGWSIHGAWNGSVAAFYTDASSERTVDDVVMGQVQAAWRAGVELVRQLRGNAPLSISIRLTPNPGVEAVCHEAPLTDETITDGPRQAVHLQRLVEVEFPDSAPLESVRRELLRAGGERAHELGTG